jgi:PAS domain S-box-containing protein
MNTSGQKTAFTCNEQLQLAVDNSRIALWDWHIPTGAVSFSPLWAEIIGYTLDELAPLSIQTWIDHTHPDDLINANIALQAHFLGDTEYYECEHRMQHRLGHWIWILDRGKIVEWDDENKPIRMIGSHQDISHQHQLTDNLMLSELRLKTLISNMFTGILLEDENRKVLLTNQALLDIFNIPLKPDDMIGFDCELAAKSSATSFLDPDAFIKDIEEKLEKREHIEGHELHA